MSRLLAITGAACLAGCALALAYRGDWLLAALFAAAVAAPAALWVSGGLAVTAAEVRESLRPEPGSGPGPAPRGEDASAMTPAQAAAMFTAFATQIDGELAAGTPPKAVAQAAADFARDYAREAVSGELAGAP